MAENGHTLRGIDYKSTFGFTHLFRGFRLAIDPSKLGLALAMLLLLYAGGRLMDSIWPARHQAVPDEVRRYETRGATFAGDRDLLIGQQRDGTLYGRVVDDFNGERLAILAAMDAGLRREMVAVGKGDQRPSAKAVEREYEKQREDAVKAARDRYDAVKGKDEDKTAARRIRDDSIQAAYATYRERVDRVERFETKGLFITLLEYEIDQVDNIAWSATRLNVYGMLDGLTHLFITAPKWAIRYHPVYFTIFFAFALLLWSIFGGAIARVAAVQVARDEKISVRQALRFSTGKVLSFIFAPLIPIIIVMVLAVILGVVGLPMSIPYVGGFWSVILGVLFFLALLAGLVMTLTTLGLIGGGHMMYPTIAVEGSDSFDAVSRSFSYLYARPWQLLLYSLVALVYGAITYLFVRFFLYVLLWLTHFGVGLFIHWADANDGSRLMTSLWPAPLSLWNLKYSPNYPGMSNVYDAGSSFMAFWVYLTISLLGAYVVSLYFSSSTIIYYLMRREVDATGLDDVYLEPSDDEFADPVGDLPGDPIADPAVDPAAAPLNPEAPPASEPAPFAPAQPPTDVPPPSDDRPIDPPPAEDENRP